MITTAQQLQALLDANRYTAFVVASDPVFVKAIDGLGDLYTVTFERQRTVHAIVSTGELLAWPLALPNSQRMLALHAS